MSLTKTITRSKPFYVVAGAGDLAVKTARELPAKLQPSRLVGFKIGREDLTKAVSTLQSEVVTLPAKAQAAAVTAAVGTVDTADAVYSELLGRGRRVVGRIRRQQATQQARSDAATTVRRARATVETAVAGAADTAAAAKGARAAAKRTTTTARKRAAATRRSAAGTTKAAARTAESTAKAVSDGAAKVGA